MITGTTNILLKHDENSMFKWDELNETNYLSNVFEELGKLAGRDLDGYEFITFAHQNGNAIPKSSIEADKGGKKKVLLFLSNEKISIPIGLSKKYFAIFKCYLGEGQRPSNVFPMPLGYANGTSFGIPIRSSERPVDIFYSGNLNKNRVALHYALNEGNKLPYPIYHLWTRLAKNLRLPLKWDFNRYYPESQISFTNGFKKGGSKKYSMFLQMSKIAICPKGFFSPETYRHSEAMKSGCVILSEKLPEHYIYKDSPIIQISDWKDALSTANELLANPDKLDELQDKTLRWWENVCSEKAYAKYMLEKLTVLSAE